MDHIDQMHLNCQKIIYSAMLYQSAINPSQKSVFRKSFPLEYRKQKRNSMIKHKKEGNYCYLVIEYSLGIKNYRDYELMCVDGKFNLKILQQFILKKMKVSIVRDNLLFQIRGKIKNPGQNIGAMSANLSDEDGFLYIFVRSQNTF